MKALEGCAIRKKSTSPDMAQDGPGIPFPSPSYRAFIDLIIKKGRIVSEKLRCCILSCTQQLLFIDQRAMSRISYAEHR